MQVKQIYRTGNTGYSKGDHLHCQMKINGHYVDPTPYVIDDKNKSYPKGTKLLFTDSMNIRNGSGADTGNIVKGAVCEVISDKLGTLPASIGDYLWLNVKFLNTTGYVAITGRFTKTTKAITQTDGKIPEPVNPCQSYIDKASKLESDIKNLENIVLEKDKVINEKSQELVKEIARADDLEQKVSTINTLLEKSEKEMKDIELKYEELKALTKENALKLATAKELWGELFSKLFGNKISEGSE